MSERTASANAVNNAVARITGINRRVFTDLNESKKDGNEFTSPSPFSTIHPSPHEERQRLYEESKKLPVRGDNAAYQYDMPASTDSQDSKIPNHRMAPKQADKDGAEDGDSAEEPVESVRVNKKAKMEAKPVTKKIHKDVMEAIGSMSSYRDLAGLPELSEAVVVGHTGFVPTAGADDENPMEAGLSGLTGKALQPVEPEGDEEEDGDNVELTLDGAIAMMKKEGIDGDGLWNEFLEAKGLSADLFNQLVDEAIEGDDADEIDALLAVEEIFLQNLPRLLPEGLGARMMGGIRNLFKSKAPEAQAAPAAAPAPLPTKPKLTPAQMAQNHAAAVHGIGKPTPATNAKMQTPKPYVQRDLNMATSVARRPGGATGSTAGATVRLPKKKVGGMPTEQTEGKTGRDWEMDCHHNPETGEPHMPWHGKMKKSKKKSKMESLAGKYSDQVVEGVPASNPKMPKPKMNNPKPTKSRPAKAAAIPTAKMSGVKGGLMKMKALSKKK